MVIQQESTPKGGKTMQMHTVIIPAFAAAGEVINLNPQWCACVCVHACVCAC